MPKKKTIRRCFPVKPPERRYGIKYRQWLEDQNSLLLLALRRSADAVMFMTVDGEATYVNPVAEKLLGKTTEQLEGNNLLHFFRSSDGEQVGDELKCQLQIQSELHCSLAFLRHSSGELIPVEMHMSELRVQDVPMRIQVTCRDMRTELEFQRQMLMQAQTDRLTSCFNRWWFDPSLAQHIDFARENEDWLGLIFIDLDRFKILNDQSYRLGDEVIQRAAETIREVIRKTSDKLVRLGGDEFVLLLQGITPEAAHHICQRILDALPQLDIKLPKPPYGRFTLTASIGLSVLHGTDPRMPEIQRYAEEAKYLAKEGGRNRTCVLPADAENQPSIH